MSIVPLAHLPSSSASSLVSQSWFREAIHSILAEDFGVGKLTCSSLKDKVSSLDESCTSAFQTISSRLGIKDQQLQTLISFKGYLVQENDARDTKIKDILERLIGVDTQISQFDQERQAFESKTEELLKGWTSRQEKIQELRFQQLELQMKQQVVQYLLDRQSSSPSSSVVQEGKEEKIEEQEEKKEKEPVSEMLLLGQIQSNLKGFEVYMKNKVNEWSTKIHEKTKSYVHASMKQIESSIEKAVDERVSLIEATKKLQELKSPPPSPSPPKEEEKDLEEMIAKEQWPSYLRPRDELPPSKHKLSFRAQVMYAMEHPYTLEQDAARKRGNKGGKRRDETEVEEEEEEEETEEIDIDIEAFVSTNTWPPELRPMEDLPPSVQDWSLSEKIKYAMKYKRKYQKSGLLQPVKNKKRRVTKEKEEEEEKGVVLKVHVARVVKDPLTRQDKYIYQCSWVDNPSEFTWETERSFLEEPKPLIEFWSKRHSMRIPTIPIEYLPVDKEREDPRF